MMWHSKRHKRRNLTCTLSRLSPAFFGVCAALIVAVLPCAGAAQTVRVEEASLAQLQIAASAAYKSGHSDQAMALTQAILARRPDDALALYLQAKLWFEAVPTDATRDAARKTIRRAYAAADSDVQHFETSVLAAQIAVSQQRWFAANGWTRISSIYAPSPQIKTQVLKDISIIQRLNPWQVAGNFTLRPSSNVNGGAATAENVIDGYTLVGRLSADAQALAGTEASASLSARYRIGQTKTTRTTLGIAAWGREVDLKGHPTREVFDLATATTDDEPIENEEFSERYLRADIAHLFTVNAAKFEVSAQISQYWQAESPIWTAHGVSARWSFDAPETWVINGSLDRRKYAESGRRDTLWAFGVARSTDIFEAGQLRTGVDWFAQRSEVNNARVERLRLKIGFEPKATWAGMHISGDATAQRSSYRDYSLLGMHPDGGRRDDQLSASLSMRRANWSLAGVVPEWTIEASRVQSNVSRFTSKEVTAGVALRSAF